MHPGILIAGVLMASQAKSGDELVDVTSLRKDFVLDIRYATTDNFFGKKVYPVGRCLLRKPVADKLVRAAEWLDQHHPGHHFMLEDCYRPHSIQFVLWDAVKGTPKSAYVADPNSKTGSIHSYGAAVDLTIVDRDGKELDMGTPYDFLGPLAEPRLEKKFLAEGKLTPAHVANRKMLKDAMVTGGGFMPIPNEWWHFDFAKKEEVRRRFERLDIPLESVP